MKKQSYVPGVAAVAAVVVAAAFGAGAVQRARHSAADPINLTGFDAAMRVASSQGAASASAAVAAVPGLKQGAGSAADNSKTAQVTVKLMENSSFVRQKLDDAVSAKLFDEFIDTLDPQRLFLLQSDVAEFASYRDQLDDQLDRGDTSFATKVFARYLERYKAQTQFALDALKDPKNFDFAKQDAFVLDRKKAPRPKDLAEAQSLWLQRVRWEYLSQKLADTKPDQIVKNLTKRYTQQRRSAEEYDSDDVFELYLTTLTHVYDPHSDYFGRASAENFSIGMKLSLYGIGARLKSEDGYTVIEDITPGSPAQKSKKLKPGDKIVAVAQGASGEPVDAVDMKLTRVVEMIRGPKGSTVRLFVEPAGAPEGAPRQIVSLVRDEIKLEEQSASGRLIVVPAQDGKPAYKLGVIDLPLFYSDPDKGKSCTADVALLLSKFKQQGVDGVVLDLRRNGGGSLDEAINLTGLFIKSGPVVQVRNPDDSVEVKDDDDASVAYDGPLLVLTTRLSASASEIVTGALQDYGRAVVVGDSSTFGKGTVQALVSLAPIMQRAGLRTEGDPGQLKLTIQKFYRASGASTQLKGVVPDIVLPSLNGALDIGETKLDNPLPYDTVKAADYKPLDRVTPFAKGLQARSAARVARDPDFRFLIDQIAQIKKVEAEKTVSLNEAARRKERQELEAKLDARDKELAARPAPSGTVYAISLADARKPGLPVPLTAAQLKKGVTGANADDDETPAPTATDDTDGAKPAKKRQPEPDADLEEAKRILTDYIAATRKAGSAWSAPLAANRK